MSATNPSLVIAISGPTASGKTAVAVELALAFQGEVVNADSMQVYRGMDIGTAKPTPEQRRRVPHHLLDIVAPDEPYHAARFAEDAERAIREIGARGHRAVPRRRNGALPARGPLRPLCGRRARSRAPPDARGRARACGRSGRSRALASAPLRARRRDRAAPPSERPGAHHSRARDPRGHRSTGLRGAAAREARMLATARSSWRSTPGREELAKRIDERCEAMIAAGLLQEVRALRDAGYGPELASMRGIGYRHMQPVIEGRETLAHVLEEVKRDTRQFARRQRTWLRGESGGRVVPPRGPRGDPCAGRRVSRGARERLACRPLSPSSRSSGGRTSASPRYSTAGPGAAARSWTTRPA